MAGLVVERVSKRFGDTQAVQDVSITIEKGEVLAVMGPSGCGKSTLLGLIAGIENPDVGQIFWQGEEITQTPIHQRGFGLMFQDYALFPHMDVFGNVAFGLRMLGMGKEAIEKRVDEVLQLVGLAGFDNRDVNTLSGGEQQRVALARALAPKPKLLMLDEPLGALDRALRERLLNDLRRILRQAEQTSLYVTHDQEEAFALADRVVVMREGQVEQIGTPQEIYQAPKNRFVAEFVGLENILVGKRQGKGMETTIGVIPLEIDKEQVTLLLRPEAARLDGQGDEQIEGRVVDAAFRGGMTRVRIEVNSVPLVFMFPSSVETPKVGEVVRLGIDVKRGVQVLEK